MIKVKAVTISLKKDMLSDIDRRRGLIPRSIYIQKVLEGNLNLYQNKVEEMICTPFLLPTTVHDRIDLSIA